MAMYSLTITVVLEHDALHPAELQSLAAAIRHMRGVSEVHVNPRVADDRRHGSCTLREFEPEALTE